MTAGKGSAASRCLRLLMRVARRRCLGFPNLRQRFLAGVSPSGQIFRTSTSLEQSSARIGRERFSIAWRPRFTIASPGLRAQNTLNAGWGENLNSPTQEACMMTRRRRGNLSRQCRCSPLRKSRNCQKPTSSVCIETASPSVQNAWTGATLLISDSWESYLRLRSRHLPPRLSSSGFPQRRTFGLSSWTSTSWCGGEQSGNSQGKRGRVDWRERQPAGVCAKISGQVMKKPTRVTPTASKHKAYVPLERSALKDEAE